MGIRGQYKNKRDGNEKDIFNELEAYGLSVYPMDAPADALVGFHGRSYLVEIKMPKGSMTKPQEEFRSTWRGDYTILRSVEDASAFARNIRAAVVPIVGTVYPDKVVWKP